MSLRQQIYARAKQIALKKGWSSCLQKAGMEHDLSPVKEI